MPSTDPAPFKWQLPAQRVEQPSPFHYLKFRLDGHLLDPATLPAITFPPELEPHRHLGLMLSGKGPLWLYGHLVHLAHVFAWVAVYDPRLSGGVVVMRHTPRAPQLGEIIPFTERTDAVPDNASDPTGRSGRLPPELLWSGKEGTPPTESITLRLAPGGGRVFDPSDLTALALPDGPPPGTECVCLSGQFPIWLVTHLVSRLHEALPHITLAVYDPKLAGAVVVADRGGLLPGLIIPDRPRATPAPLVALIGDPNSGKSVLSWKLYHALQARGKAVYRLDCDAYAPTAGWCLDSATGQRLRQEYKRERGEWRQEDVDGLAAAARQMQRAALDLGLLDMPGGLHQGVLDPVRIPAGREGLFALADAFVLLQRDEAAKDGWRRALDEHGLADRIIARVCPCKDCSAAEVCPGLPFPGEEVPTWTIHALDRELTGERTPGVVGLADYLLARLGGLPA